MQIPNIFTSFSPKIFLTIFLVKSKLSTAKKSKTTTFSPPKKLTIFSGNQSWIFGQKMKISNSVLYFSYSWACNEIMKHYYDFKNPPSNDKVNEIWWTMFNFPSRITSWANTRIPSQNTTLAIFKDRETNDTPIWTWRANK